MSSSHSYYYVFPSSLIALTTIYTLGVGDGQRGLACCDSWGRKESDTTELIHGWFSPGAFPVRTSPSDSGHTYSTTHHVSQMQYGHIIKTESICVSKDITGSEKRAYRTGNKSASPISYLGFPGGTAVRNPPGNAGDTRDMGSIPGSGRSPGVGNGNPLQYSCLGNPMDKGARWAKVHEITKS